MKSVLSFGAILAIAVSTVVAQGGKRPLTTLVAAEGQTVGLGDPIKVSVVASNQTTQVVLVNRSATAFDCFEIIDSDGNALPYVGFDGQAMVNPVPLQPFSEGIIADKLDLTSKYLFREAGRYSIRFKGGISDLSDSPAVMVDVTTGRLSQFDQLVARLLPVAPKGWHLAKDGQGEVTPSGRLPVSGFVLHVCHNHMRAEAVYLWFTKGEAKIDQNQQPAVKSEYLGRALELLVYAKVESNTPVLWPAAKEDISRALQITKQ